MRSTHVFLAGEDAKRAGARRAGLGARQGPGGRARDQLQEGRRRRAGGGPGGGCKRAGARRAEAGAPLRAGLGGRGRCAAERAKRN